MARSQNRNPVHATDVKSCVCKIKRALIDHEHIGLIRSGIQGSIDGSLINKAQNMGNGKPQRHLLWGARSVIARCSFIQLTHALIIMLSILHVVTAVDVINVQSQEVAYAVQTALEELRKASDSGVYETLELVQVRGATAREGRFHRILELELDLASQHLASGTFSTQVIVMKDTNDSNGGPEIIRSVAISELPEFPPHVVEAFQRKSMKRAASRRENLYAEIEREYLESQRLTAELSSVPEQISVQLGIAAITGAQHEVLEALATRTLLDMKQLPQTSLELRYLIDGIIQDRLNRLQAMEAGSYNPRKPVVLNSVGP
mmetsp:Transcript_22104/g.43508  ORF Transcript_22104/g.43508 Transcript_22104/m.43508 type:complete len:318 (-) Transcript_22104:256-1209(-)